MASLHGKDGSVTWGAIPQAVDTVTSWTINTVADTAETTSMADATAGYKTYIAGFLDWTATVECVLSNDGLHPDIDATGIQDRNGAELILHGGTAASSRKYTGNAICTGITTTLDLNDAVKVTYNFEGSGILAEAADA